MTNIGVQKSNIEGLNYQDSGEKSGGEAKEDANFFKDSVTKILSDDLYKKPSLYYDVRIHVDAEQELDKRIKQSQDKFYDVSGLLVPNMNKFAVEQPSEE